MDPTVLIDGRALQGPDAARGIGRYAFGLLGGLAARGFDTETAVLLDGRLAVPDLPVGSFRVVTTRHRYQGRLAAWEDAVALARDIASVRPRIFHALSLRLPGRVDRPVVATLHDLIPWALGGRGYLGERVRFGLARRLVRRAHLVLAVSQATADDAMRIAKIPARRIRVVHPGIDAGFEPLATAADEVRARWNLERPYLLYVGALDPRKDPRALVRAWTRARELGLDAELVLAGQPGSHRPRELQPARALGPVSVAELSALYSSAVCLLFPSRYEGFGLPLVEAMACGCPVVAYANSSVPEVVGDAGLLVRDLDADALGSAVWDVARDEKLRERLRRRGLRRARSFTWDAAARRTISAYEELLA